MASYSLINNTYRGHNYYNYIGPGSRTIITADAARAQGSTTKSQLRHNNGTDEQGFGCCANGRSAHILGGTTPGARHARPSGYSRRSEEASTLPAARAKNNKADGVNFTPITLVALFDPQLLENLIDMEKIDAKSVDYCTDESVMESLESTHKRDASVRAEFFKAEVLVKVTFALS
jgi:hypothetical protein